MSIDVLLTQVPLTGRKTIDHYAAGTTVLYTGMPPPMQPMRPLNIGAMVLVTHFLSFLCLLNDIDLIRVKKVKNHTLIIS